MKTLLLLSSLLVSSILITAYFSSQEEAQQYSERTFGDLDRRVRKLEREQRMGPKPYCLTHKVGIWTDAQHDSVLVYLSHMTRWDLLEVKYGITEDIALKAFIDTIIAYKDSTEQRNED